MMVNLVFVLILWSGNYRTLEVHDFYSESSCQYALKQVKEASRNRIDGVCVAK